MTPILVREVSSLILRPPVVAIAAPSSHVRFGKDAAKEKAKDNGQDHARYYGVITLNQVMLNRSQAEVAGKMIEVYFEIFGDILGRVAEEEAAALEEGAEGEGKKPFIKKKFVKGGKPGKGKNADDEAKGEGEVSEMDSKLVAAVLTGVNRAFPFAKIDDEAYVLSFFPLRINLLTLESSTDSRPVSIRYSESRTLELSTFPFKLSC
jgi:ribosome biogenesis protein MAK21